MTYWSRAMMSIVMAAWLGGLAPGAARAADPVFANPILLGRNGVTFNGGAISTFAADLDHDGRDEFISTASRSSSDGHFRVYDFNLSTRSFDVFDLLDPALIQAPAPQRQDRFGGDLAVGDIDNDGFLDIIVPESNNANGSGQVSWFKSPAGNLASTWTEQVISTWTGSGSLQQVAHMSDVAVGDVDGNGRLDVVTRDISHGFYVLLQTSGGTWATRQHIPTHPREGLTLFNPDGDGNLDIALNGVWFETTSAAAGSYTQRAISGAANWYPTATTSDTIADYASQVEVGDFNGDGRDDLAITNAEELTNAASTVSKPLGIQIFLAPADPIGGAWTPVTLTNQQFSWHSLEIGDVDGDGDFDLISGISMVGADADSGQKIVAFLNDGDGMSFTEFIIDTAFIYNASLGDVDGDGDLDLLAPHTWDSGPLRFYENLTAVPEPTTAAIIGIAALVILGKGRRYEA